MHTPCGSCAECCLSRQNSNSRTAKHQTGAFRTSSKFGSLDAAGEPSVQPLWLVDDQVEYHVAGEIQTAIDTGHGVDIRNNEHGQETMFVAVSRPVTDKENPDSYFSADKNVTLVVSKELSELNSVIAKLHKEVIVSSSILIGIAGIFGIVVMRRINRKTREDSANLEHRVETRTEEIVMLQMLSSLLNTCGSLDEASKVISELIPKILPGSCGGISIFKASRNRLDLMVHWGDHFPSKLSMMPHDCWSLRKGHQHSTLDRGVLLPCDHWLTSSEHTICMPLLAQGETVGVLHIEYQDSIAFKETAHLREAIAEQTGLTLANIRLRQELREQARKDPMTGMYNRLHLMEELENTMHPDADGIVKCAVLMVDADHFKSFNDNFGHDAGDMVLKAIAGKIEDGSRETGLACRYGGEEFCVLMPGATIETAMRTGEAIRESISELDLSMNGLPLGKVSVSIGAAVAPEHTTDKYQIISLADAALYKAKENGRNCVEMYNPDPAKPALVDDTPVDDIRKVS